MQTETNLGPTKYRTQNAVLLKTAVFSHHVVCFVRGNLQLQLSSLTVGICMKTLGSVMTAEIYCRHYS